MSLIQKIIKLKLGFLELAKTVVYINNIKKIYPGLNWQASSDFCKQLF